MNYLTEINWFTKVADLTPAERAKLDAWRVELWAPFTPEPLDTQHMDTANGLVQEQEVAKAYAE